MRQRWKICRIRAVTYLPAAVCPWSAHNTAGSGNDFVGGTNGYGNVEFNGLPALSNGNR